MSTKHTFTPGPWEINHDLSDIHSIAILSALRDDERLFVAQVLKCNDAINSVRDEPICQANAQLIAAAGTAATAAEALGFNGQASIEALPELLEICRRILCRCELEVDPSVLSEPLRAAIAKAEGKES